MSKENEEPMDITSATDLEAQQITHSKKHDVSEEQMETEEIIEGEESQEEDTTGKRFSTPTREIIEPEDEKEISSKSSGIDKEIISNVEKETTDDVDMKTPGRDETDKKDASEKTSDNSETKIDSSKKETPQKVTEVSESIEAEDKEVVDSENAKKTSDDNETSDADTKIDDKGTDSDKKTTDVNIETINDNSKNTSETSDNETHNSDITKKPSDDNIETKDKQNDDRDITDDNTETADNETDNSQKPSNDSIKIVDKETVSEKTSDDTTKADDNLEKSDDANKESNEIIEKTLDKNQKTSDTSEKTSNIVMEVDNDTENKGTANESNDIPSTSNDKQSSVSAETESGDISNEKTGDDSTMSDPNSIFVQVNTENNEKDDSEKPSLQSTSDVDPIGSLEWNQNTESNFVSELDEADECIIPDANREEITSLPPKEIPLSQTSTSAQSNDSMRISEKYLVSVANSDDQSSCMICETKTLCKYNCSKDNVKTTICSEDCLSKLKAQHLDNVIVRQLRVKNFSLDKNLQRSTIGEAPRVEETSSSDTTPRTITCVNCSSSISDINNSLSWEALDFCDEQCLTKHQKLIGSFCANCHIDVKDNFLGKYCVRFGYNVRQFCSSTCLEEYKKSSKVCSFCQDDISGNTSGFLTSIGDKGSSKDFCSANCMQKYSQINKQSKSTKTTGECCVCHKTNTIEIEFDFKSKNNHFCSEPCFVAFKYVNDVKPEKCDMCCKYYIPPSQSPPCLMRYDGVIRKFCLKTCQNIYITTNRKIVSCCWCKVKKYNFDMIQKYMPDSNVLIVCSLTCLNFFNASMNATKLKKKRCDFCNKICKGQYHITLADDSMKNFCSYPCVQEYQSKYILAPARFTEQPVASPSQALPTRASTRKSQQRKQIIPDVPGPLPIITSVRSLAPTANQSSTRQLRSKTSAPSVTTVTTLQTEPAVPPPVRRVVVLRPPDLPLQRNMATLVKPITRDVEAEFKPIMVDKAVQTEDLKDSLILVPIPVPIYVPAPMQMFQLTHPVPLPFPFPIPIPMFIPVTKQTSGVVLKEMKKTQIKTDPYEADLLMMAELVAGEVEKKEPPPEIESDGESAADNQPPETYSPEPPDASNTFGDDMLQMALKMATDFEEPAVDLEGALTASTITATAASNEPEEITPIPPPVERTTFRGRRRGRPPRHGGRGRGRGRPPTNPDPIIPPEPEPQQPPEPVEKPDANMCLKYTFGVNAWKQWVTTKNAELERSSRRSKQFKTDLLQLTSDELNYSLCLFVKEVRKPNGAEYAPDTIYYLCLGIQQYLFENGRIDNIFCDSYYESFTDCLDEVCKKFSTLYNDSQYIVTRVEEEHLWESKQLGAHSPHVLLSTLMFFNTKHFNLTNVEEHMQLSFSHIMKHWKRVPNQTTGTAKNSNSSSRNILLRFYPPQSAIEGNNRKKKVYEQQENEENPLRCPVKLYEFYLSKCPESVKTRNDVFYLLPERSCVPDSPVWYSTMALGKEPLEKMLHRVKMVKEINVALLAS